MAKVLTFVDEPLARQIATGLIGSEIQLSERKGSTFGINFKVIVSNDRAAERTVTTRVSELLPELIADALYDAIADRIENLDEARGRLIAGNEKSFHPGTPIIVSGAQLAKEGKKDGVLSGEKCTQYRLKIAEFYMHAYCAKSAETIFDSLVGQPIVIAGLLRYTPPYSVPGALSLNLGVRTCAAWLR